MKPALLLTAAILATSAFAAGESVKHVNGAIDIGASQEAGDLSTVNGSIHVGAHAKVGGINSVNGGQSLGEGATAAAMNTVNGSIELAKGARVSGDLRSVNGGLTLNSGAEVMGALTNVNGSIVIDGAHLVGRITTVGGNISVLNGGRVDGGILVKAQSGFSISFMSTLPRIVIGPGASVAGPLTFERDVKLFVSDQAKVVGKIVGATPVKFSGATPPG